MGLIAALAFAAWGDYRLWRVRQDADDYAAALYPENEPAADEVNGSDLLDAVSALTRVSWAEADDDPAAAVDTSAFAQAMELIRRHAEVSASRIRQTSPEALGAAALDRSGGPRGHGVIRGLRHKAAEFPVDPFTGDPPSWRGTRDGCVVYSIGRNREDDGGADRREGRGHYDVAWRLPCDLIPDTLIRASDQAAS